eukprot:COSAG06_NODE_42650_length_379_cov_3.439286_1_plen_92_part_01
MSRLLVLESAALPRGDLRVPLVTHEPKEKRKAATAKTAKTTAAAARFRQQASLLGQVSCCAFLLPNLSWQIKSILVPHHQAENRSSKGRKTR